MKTKLKYQMDFQHQKKCSSSYERINYNFIEMATPLKKVHIFKLIYYQDLNDDIDYE